MTLTIRPILLAFETLPDAAYVAPLTNAIHGPNGIQKFLDSYGMAQNWGPVERLAYTGIDYRTGVDNPWYDVYKSLALGIDDWAVAVLVDWIEPGPQGWGGTPLAIAGSYVANRLLSPDLVDDFPAEGVLCHEVCHVIGYPHDLTRENNIMGVGLWNYPNTGPSQLMIDNANARLPLAQGAVARLASFGGPVMFGTECPRKPE